jgi:ATP-binding cassette subfamily A (ABC1) protein 3
MEEPGENDMTLMERPQVQNTDDGNIMQIENLCKQYGKVKAVENLSLTMFRDEIVVLLGHNGAGKTTTISMLIGDTVPTSGTAKAFGKDLLGD